MIILMHIYSVDNRNQAINNYGQIITKAYKMLLFYYSEMKETNKKTPSAALIFSLFQRQTLNWSRCCHCFSLIIITHSLTQKLHTVIIQIS